MIFKKRKGILTNWKGMGGWCGRIVHVRWYGAGRCVCFPCDCYGGHCWCRRHASDLGYGSIEMYGMISFYVVYLSVTSLRRSIARLIQNPSIARPPIFHESRYIGVLAARQLGISTR